MGWFWADNTLPSRPTAPHPIPSSNASPPPSCPMHKATPPLSSSPPPSPSDSSSACPYVPPDTSPTKTPSSSTTLSKLNPLNYMPTNLSNQRASTQKISLPLSRETSTIPKGDPANSKWEYPSPQQMYNAMLRKGYTDTPEDAVESMVAVHNFLNEGAWAEILEWERRFGNGLARGWRECRKGEQASQSGAMIEGSTWDDAATPPPALIRFMGRPTDMTPKAQFLQTMGWVWPGKYGGEPPFDRHDWFVRRYGGEGQPGEEVRYVIDYYSGPPEPTGEPVFFLDVRPAVDTPSAAVARVMRWGGDVWWRGTGGVVRETKAAVAAAKADVK
ncbi:hypothetical protein EJ08DRAFT_652218 [Tothia fuscella]|uniref:Holocytochrome c-type synthase n=1 Tax=Tothia fuscella TaxID=1048955 RepID=A0A9P4TVR0_9PEZI|nr:hypothetical protein EJ08DRAFT_652218 [Tothia fuscella]